MKNDNKKFEQLHKMIIGARLKEMIECEHLFIKTDEVHERSDNGSWRRSDICHCLKCGLTNKYWVRKYPISSLNIIQDTMSSIYYDFDCKGDFITNCTFELVTAMGLYETIMKINPEISKSELTKIFPILYNADDKLFTELLQEMQQCSHVQQNKKQRAKIKNGIRKPSVDMSRFV